MRTEAVTIPSYNIDNGRAAANMTNANSANQQYNTLFRDPALKTTPSLNTGERTTFKLAATNEAPTQSVLPLQRGLTEAAATVSSVEKDFVVCEVLRSNGSISVKLPLAIFPSESLFYGAPISISVIDTDGYRRPHVIAREVEPSPRSQEIQDLLNALR